MYEQKMCVTADKIYFMISPLSTLVPVIGSFRTAYFSLPKSLKARKKGLSMRFLAI